MTGGFIFLRERVRNRCLIPLILLLLMLATIPGFAQQTLADADWFERDLGDGVTWRFFLFDNLYGSMQSVSYIEADLNNTNVSVEIPYLETGYTRTSSMVPSQFPAAVAGMNGTYFNTSTGGHRTYLRINNTEIPAGGVLFSPWGYDSAIAKDSSDNVSVQKMPSGGWSNNTTHPDIIACGPLLIDNGVIPTTYLASIGSHSTSRHPRSAAGITGDNKLILLTVDGRTDRATGMTCTELAEVMEDLGCLNAINYDGGGSSTLWGDGEPYSGVLNYPSDNSVYDHLGERSCANAIAVISTAPSSKSWDGRLTSKSFTGTMDMETEQTVTLTYENIGTETWTATDTKLVLARPEGRTSDFEDVSWVSSTQPVLMTPSTVAQGETATFSFKMKAPTVATTTVYDENFMLTQTGQGRIGPSDSDAWIKIVVEPPPTGGASFIVESRSGGLNYAWYSDSGFADSGVNCTADGCTGNIGMRYGSTYRSIAGSKTATAAPNFPGSGNYKVSVAWGSGSNRRNPITFNVNHASGTDTFQLDQSSISNIWIQLGTDPFYFNEGYGNSVNMTNEDIDVSGSMYIGGFKFEFVPEAKVENWVLY